MANVSTGYMFPKKKVDIYAHVPLVKKKRMWDILPACVLSLTKWWTRPWALYLIEFDACQASACIHIKEKEELSHCSMATCISSGIHASITCCTNGNKATSALVSKWANLLKTRHPICIARQPLHSLSFLVYGWIQRQRWTKKRRNLH